MSDTSDSGLILLGTFHHDRDGFRRTLHALKTFRPERVLLELSPFAWAFRIRHGRFYLRVLTQNLETVCRGQRMLLARALKHPEIQLIFRQIRLPFEYLAAVRYANEAPASLHLIDRSSYSSKLLLSWPELVSKANVLLLLQRRSVRDSTQDQYRKAARLLFNDEARSPLHSAGGQSQSFARPWSDRERYLALQVERAMAMPCHGRHLYLGGWEHLSPHPDSLRSLAQAHSPEVHLLDAF